MPKPVTSARRFFLLMLFAVAVALSVTAQASTALMQRMVGAWVDGENYFELGAEGQVVIHLKAGQVAGKRTLEGDWWVGEDGTLMFALVVLDRAPRRVGLVRFDGDDMLFENDDGSVTRNRRNAGALPAEFVW